jgi:hypothetical protein
MVWTKSLSLTQRDKNAWLDGDRAPPQWDDARSWRSGPCAPSLRQSHRVILSLLASPTYRAALFSGSSHSLVLPAYAMMVLSVSVLTQLDVLAEKPQSPAASAHVSANCHRDPPKSRFS